MHLEPSSGRHAGLRGTGTPRTPASQRVLAELNASAVFDFHFIQDTDQGKGEGSGRRRDLLKAAVPSLCRSWACLPSTAFPASCSALRCCRRRELGEAEAPAALGVVKLPASVVSPPSPLGPFFSTAGTWGWFPAVANLWGTPLPCLALSNTTACYRQFPALNALYCMYLTWFWCSWLHIPIQNMCCFLQIILSN